MIDHKAVFQKQPESRIISSDVIIKHRYPVLSCRFTKQSDTLCTVSAVAAFRKNDDITQPYSSFLIMMVGYFANKGINVSIMGIMTLALMRTQDAEGARKVDLFLLSNNPEDEPVALSSLLALLMPKE